MIEMSIRTVPFHSIKRLTLSFCFVGFKSLLFSRFFPPRHGSRCSLFRPSLQRGSVGIRRDHHEDCESAGRSSVKFAGRGSLKPASQSSDKSSGRSSVKPAGRSKVKFVGRRSLKPAGRDSLQPRSLLLCRLQPRSLLQAPDQSPEQAPCP